MSTRDFSDGTREIEYRYELLERGTMAHVADVSNKVTEATVSHNAFATVHRTASFKIKEDYTQPETVIKDMEKDFLTPDYPFTVWDNPNLAQVKDGRLYFPTYKVYNGDYPDLDGGKKSVTVGSENFAMGEIPNGFNLITDMPSATDGFCFYYPAGTAGNFTGASCELWKKTNTQRKLAIETISSISATPKRVYFTGYFNTDGGVTKPQVFVRYYSGTTTVSTIEVPSNQITTQIADGYAEWSFYEGYVDITSVAGANSCRLQIGIQGTQIGSLYIDSFYYDAARSARFTYEVTVTSPEIDASFISLNGVPAKFGGGGIMHTKYDPSSLSGLYVRNSLDSGSTWGSWTSIPSNIASFPLALNTDVRNLKFQLQFRMKSHDQKILPRLDFYDIDLKANCNVPNPNYDVIDYKKHYIKPYLKINESGTWKEYPLGVFLLNSPKRSDDDGGVIREVDAYDRLVILKDAKLVYPLTLKPHSTDGWAGTVRDLLTGNYSELQLQYYSFGDPFLASQVNITPSPPVPSARGRNFKMGETWLSVLNQLLSAAGNTSLHCDSNGILRSETYVVPSSIPEKFTYIDDHTSIIFTKADEEIDTFETANVFIAVQMADSGGNQLVARYFNFNDGAPSSVPEQGRYIVDYQEVDHAETQWELDNYVRRIAYEASQAYGQIHFNTALDPEHEHLDNVYLRYQDLKLEGKFTETAWSMSLTDDPYMEHRLRRIVTI